MGQVQDYVTEMTAEERQTLSTGLDQLGRIRVLLLLVNGLGGLFVACVAILSVMILRRSNREVVAAHAELEYANAGLERRVAAHTADLQEANDELQRYSYIVSHDLRSPLINIMGFTGELEALKNDVMTRSAAANQVLGGARAERRATRPSRRSGAISTRLWFIRSSTSKMDRLINAILQLSRVGRREFKAETVDLDGLVGTLAADFGHKAQKGNLRLAIGKLPTIASDRLALEQIISNLLDNAIKYLRDGVPGQVDVSAKESRDTVSIEVADNGRGIDERDLERIFDLFRRAGAQDRPGEGIGLAHVRTLVRRLGGTIKVSSRLDHGSTFAVTLPKIWRP